MSLLVPALIGVLIVVSAAVAMSLRSLVHSALCLTLNWLGIAAFYLWARAEFVAFAQALVYVGAVSMVVLFAVLLTRDAPEEERIQKPETLARAAAGFLAAAVVAGVLCGAVMATELPSSAGADGSGAAAVTVRGIGERLAGPEAAALLATGVLLTVALIGAVVLAARENAGGRSAGS
ncbi:MAG: NADH-quinone oxidoreductase subunit J family protein [Opitutaceae bacterium]